LSGAGKKLSHLLRELPFGNFRGFFKGPEYHGEAAGDILLWGLTPMPKG